MTCIVGIEGKNTVWLGGDSAATAGDGSQTLIADKKVFVNANGEVIFGICGSPKLIDPLRYTVFAKQKRGEDNREFVATVLVPMIKHALKESGCVTEHPEHGEHFQGEVLFGVGGKLYRMQSNFQLITDSQGYASVGSGSDIAIGSLHATRRDSNARRRILTALEASALANAGVRPPFAIVSVRKGWFR